jgi:hypothetical protein
MRYKAIALLFFTFAIKMVSAQTALLHNYETSTDAENGSKVLKGLLNRSDIVEYKKEGQIDKELGEIVNTIQ